MKNKILSIASCLFLALSSIYVSAQTTTELKAFENAAGNGSVLFRGKQANAYQHAANGNPSWTSTAFVPGEIVFEDRFYDDILVNIDAVSGQVLVRREGSPIAIELPVGSVSAITTANSHFEKVPDGVEGIPEGLYEILGDGDQKVYKHVKKQLKTGVQNMNGGPIGYVDPGATVNIIRNGKTAEKKTMKLPEILTDVIKCKNPRCITTTEQELKHVFRLADAGKMEYRCIYCETRAE